MEGLNYSQQNAGNGDGCVLLWSVKAKSRYESFLSVNSFSGLEELDKGGTE